MPISEEWTDWHLTPRGWKCGTEQKDYRRVDRTPPADRVLTSKYRLYLRSSDSMVDKGHEDIWRSPDSDVVDELLKLYGNPPEHL